MEEQIKSIPIAQIDPFPNHPFQVRMDDEMQELVESIREHGVISPVVVRPKKGERFECISGHRRLKASELAGRLVIRAYIRSLSDDEAIILMVESNFQRSFILPSEKAFSYKMRLDAMKRQGLRVDLTCTPMEYKLKGTKSIELVSNESTDSREQIRRYIRLTELIPDLLKMVDEGKIAFRPAVELSYLKKAEQKDLLDTISYEDATPSLSQALEMKLLSKEGSLCMDKILEIMSRKKPNQQEKIYVSTELTRTLIPRFSNPKQTEAYIIRALEYFREYRKKQKERT